MSLSLKQQISSKYFKSRHVQRCEAVIRSGPEIAGYGSHGKQLSHMRVLGLPKDDVADRECWLQM